MPIEGFKAVWVCSHGLRIEWYPHVSAVYALYEGIGYKPLSVTVEDVISTLGKPAWM